MYKALIVEDDEDLCVITAAHLTHAGYEVDKAGTCAAAEELLAKKKYDLILLDELLTDCSGDKLCREIRSRCACPIIFMSCMDDSETIISALRSGGDDYMVKPVNYEELLARADAIIRRSGARSSEMARSGVQGGIMEFKHFAVDTVHRCILHGEERTELSSIEYSLLLYMVQHPDTLLLYHDLYQNVWSTDSLGDVRTVMVHISNLRKKVDPDRLGIISTVRNAGYIFSDL